MQHDAQSHTRVVCNNIKFAYARTRVPYATCSLERRRREKRAQPLSSQRETSRGGAVRRATRSCTRSKKKKNTFTLYTRRPQTCPGGIVSDAGKSSSCVFSRPEHWRFSRRDAGGGPLTRLVYASFATRRGILRGFGGIRPRARRVRLRANGLKSPMVLQIVTTAVEDDTVETQCLNSVRVYMYDWACLFRFRPRVRDNGKSSFFKRSKRGFCLKWLFQGTYSPVF